MTEIKIQDAIEKAISAICEKLADFIAHVKDIPAEDAKPRTITPRYPVRCIGCRPETRNRKPTIIRRGCRHK